MELEEVLKKYKKPKKPMPLKNILRVFIREGIENFYICRKEDVDVLIEGVDRLQEENEYKKTYEYGLVVGTKRERAYWQNKIREKIKEYKNIFDMGEEWYTKQYIIEVLEELLK